MTTRRDEAHTTPRTESRVGSAVVGGLGEVLGMPYAVLLLAALPLAGIASLGPQRGRVVEVEMAD